MFAPLKNWGLRSATTVHRTMRSMRMPSSFLISCNGQSHNSFLTAFRSIENAGDTAVVHDSDAIAVAEDFFHVAADHQNRHACLSQPPHQMINLGFGADVDSSRGLIEENELGAQ